MRAVVKYSLQADAVELRDVPDPQLRAGTVLVAPRRVGVCGSDVHMWQNNQSWETRENLVLGHEAAGVIVDAADDVEGYAVGDRVVLETAAHICGTCALCRSGRYNLCPHRRGYGAMEHGSMSELVLAAPRVLHRIPEGVTFGEASMTEPYCVAYNALVERAPLAPGETVVVQGVGPIGALCIQLARLRGAGTVIALGTAADAIRLQAAKGFGADHVLDITAEDPVALVHDIADGLGADLVVDATGVSAALQQGLELVRPFGSIVKVGWGPQPLAFSLDPLVAKAVTLYGTFSHTWNTWERVLAVFESGGLQPDSVIGGTYPLTEWREAFEAMESGRNVKSVLSVSS